MKKPLPLNIKKFFTILGLVDKNGLEQGKYNVEQISCYEHLLVIIRDISSTYVDATLLCSIPEAIEIIKQSTGLECEKIKDYDATTWRFKLAGQGYINLENYKNERQSITLDNGI